ncbi:unnamed protein product, partial [Cyprideis torosa]
MQAHRQRRRQEREERRRLRREEEEREILAGSPIMAVAPSPFLTHAAYKDATIAAKKLPPLVRSMASFLSHQPLTPPTSSRLPPSSTGASRGASGRGSPLSGRNSQGASDGDSDRMSLMSISSGEEFPGKGGHQSGVPIPGLPPSLSQPPPGYDPSVFSHFPPGYQGGYMPPFGLPGYPFPPGTPGDWGQSSKSSFPSVAPPPMFPGSAPGFWPASLPPPPTSAAARTETSTPQDEGAIAQYKEEGRYKDLINLTLSRIVPELKAVLHKDFTKRMIETHGYKLFSDWWDRESRSYHLKENRRKGAAEEAGGTVPAKEDQLPVMDLVTSTLTTDTSALDTFGLGFRAALPKMPSFRRKIKPPSPPREEGEEEEEEEDEEKEDEKSPLDEGEEEESSSSSSAMEDSEKEEDAVMSEEEDEEEKKKKAKKQSAQKKRRQRAQAKAKEAAARKKAAAQAQKKKAQRKNSKSSSRSSSSSSSNSSDEEEKEEKMDVGEEAKAQSAPEPTTASPVAMGGPSRSPTSAPPTPGKGLDSPTSAKQASDMDASTPSPIEVDHCYCRPKTEPPAPVDPSLAAFDHPYASLKKADEQLSASQSKPEEMPRPKELMDHDGLAKKESKDLRKEEKRKERKRKAEERAQRKKFYEEIRAAAKSTQPFSPASVAPPAAPKPPTHGAGPKITKSFPKRDIRGELAILYQCLTHGIDAEDIEYLRRAYEKLLLDDHQSYWLNETHWVPHPPTFIPSAEAQTSVTHRKPKRRKRGGEEVEMVDAHKTGSARTEGYYKLDIKEKKRHK